MITRRHVRRPVDLNDALHMRGLSGVMMEAHLAAPWWNLRAKVVTYIGARAYAHRVRQWRRVA